MQLQIIPAARTEAEQLDLLQSIAAATATADKLILDVTHSFRHLPILAYTAVLYLQTVQPNLQVQHILYGEYDDETKQGQVHDLVGLLAINRWSITIQHSEATGDYASVSELLDDSELGKQLSEASFYESIHRGTQARKPLKDVRKKIHETPLTGPAALFQPLLLERTNWVDEDKLFQRQRAQTFRSLERKDYLRAALYGFEAFLTRKIQQSGTVQAGQEGQYEQRKNLQSILDQVQQQLERADLDESLKIWIGGQLKRSNQLPAMQLIEKAYHHASLF